MGQGSGRAGNRVGNSLLFQMAILFCLFLRLNFESRAMQCTMKLISSMSPASKIGKHMDNFFFNFMDFWWGEAYDFFLIILTFTCGISKLIAVVELSPGTFCMISVTHIQERPISVGTDAGKGFNGDQGSDCFKRRS